jgi:hypothetical protein
LARTTVLRRQPNLGVIYETEHLEALNQIDSVLREQETVRGIPSLAQVCGQYHNVRPLVEKSLWLIEMIPIYGSKIAGTIRFLTKVADLACPAAPAQR